MITKLEVSNFKSLGPKTVIDFDKLTALVGVNGSGKSNIVDVPRFFADIMKNGLSGSIIGRGGIKAIRRWSAGHPLNISMKIHFQSASFHGHYGFTITGDSASEYNVAGEKAMILHPNGERYEFEIENHDWKSGSKDLRPHISNLDLALPLISGDDRFRPMGDFLRNIEIYTIFPDTLRLPQKYSPQRPMDPHGKNWISTLKDQEESTWKPEFLTALRTLTGEIDEIEFPQVGGYLTARFRHGRPGKSEKAKMFEVSQESDGTLRVAGIIAALLQVPCLPLIGIEEPELTVHPGALRLIFDYVEQATKNSQVLISTHSPGLLDYIPIDSVRVVTKEGGVTKVGGISKDQKAMVHQKLMTLGQVHYSEGLRREGQLSLFGES